MATEDLFINKGGNRQTVEAVGESFPQLDGETAFAFVVEAVDAVDGGTLVIAAQQKEVLWVLDLVGQQQTNCLKRRRRLG